MTVVARRRSWNVGSTFRQSIYGGITAAMANGTGLHPNRGIGMAHSRRFEQGRITVVTLVT